MSLYLVISILKLREIENLVNFNHKTRSFLIKKDNKGIGMQDNNSTYCEIVGSLVLTEENVDIICYNPNFNREILGILTKWNFNNDTLTVYEEISKTSPSDRDEVLLPCNWKSIPLEIIKKNTELPWNIEILKQNPSIPQNIFENIKIAHNTYNFLSSCASITIHNVLNRLDAPWNWNRLTVNIGIKLEDIRNNQGLPWIGIELREDINLEMLLQFENFIKNKSDVYLNLSFEDLHKLPSTSLKPKTKKDYFTLSRNPNLTWKLIKVLNNNYKEWDIKYLSKHPGIPFKVIKKYSFHEFPIKLTQYHIINKSRNLSWDPKNIMLNPNIKWKNIVKYKDKFGWSGDVIRWFSGNPNLTFEIFKSKPQSFWINSQLLVNKYGKDKRLIAIKKKEKRIIYNHYMKIILNRNGDMGPLFSMLPLEILEIIKYFFKQSLKH